MLIAQRYNFDSVFSISRMILNSSIFLNSFYVPRGMNSLINHVLYLRYANYSGKTFSPVIKQMLSKLPLGMDNAIEHT